MEVGLVKLLRKVIKEIQFFKQNEFGNFWNYRHGFLKSSISICGINKSNYKNFLTDRDYMLGHPYNGAYTSIIDNKLYLPYMLHNYKEYIPKYYLFIDDSGLLPLEDYYLDCHDNVRVTVEDFLQLLKEQKKLVLKHTHSSSGHGFMFVKYDACKYYLNNKEISKDELKQLVISLKQYIITEYVEQDDYSATICSSSLNTIRFLCFWDDIKKTFFLARCFQRFGCNGSVVDNVGSGSGLCVFVDVNTGILSAEGNINFNGSGDVFARDIVHPDHNIKLTGISIPRFNKIKNKIIEILNRHSYLRYVGLDVAVTKDGFKIIELNSLSSLDAVQQKEGFLLDSRIKKVFKK